MSTPTVNKNLLDQLTAAATGPQPQPSALGFNDPTADANAAGANLPPVFPVAPVAPSAGDQSTSDLENRAASPEEMANRVAATQAQSQPGFLERLKNMAAGATGFESPNSSPDAAHGAHIMNLIGAVGNALALAKGTPEQKELAEKSEEQQRELPLRMTQLQNEQAYRDALLGNSAAKTALQYGPQGTSRITANASQERAGAASDVANARVRQIDAALAGQVYVDPAIATAVHRPDLAGQTISPVAYTQQVANPLKTYGYKTQDFGDEGVWTVSPVTGQKVARLGDSPSSERANALLERGYQPVNDAAGNTVGWINPATRHFVTPNEIQGVAGAPSPTAVLGTNVVPPKPTSSMLTQGQMAQTVSDQVPTLTNEITQLASKVGPGAGRWNDFWVNKGGINDPDFARVNQDLQFFATAMAKVHFGASAPQSIADGLMKDFSLAQSPQDLQARIASADSWMNGYAAFAGGRATHKAPGSPASPSSSNAEPPKQSFADWKHSQTTGGK